MLKSLVPTAGELEAEETAKWDYNEDAEGLPPELTQMGITHGAFYNALFTVADKVHTSCHDSELFLSIWCHSD